MNSNNNTVEEILNEKVTCPRCHFTHQLSDEDFARLSREIDQYTQSKLKAFAGEVEEAIGEDNGCGFCGDQVQTELRKSLKAIKEKAGIE